MELVDASCCKSNKPCNLRFALIGGVIFEMRIDDTQRSKRSLDRDLQRVAAHAARRRLLPATAEDDWRSAATGRRDSVMLPNRCIRPALSIVSIAGRNTGR